MTTLKNFVGIAFPLMLSSLSTMLMIAVDRLMLASYDLMAMNAITVIGILLFLMEHSICSITSMSEVLSGQFNGAGKYDKVAGPAWQMLYFAIFCCLIFIPIGLFAGPYIIQPIFHEQGLGFFRILMCFLFLSPAFAAIAGFFVGTKQTKVIAVAMLIANAVNIGLDYLFIFGIKGWLEPMGMTGAAIGSSIALALQFIIIFSIFLSRKQHLKYNTRHWNLDLRVMIACLKIGLPNAIGWIGQMTGVYAVTLIVTDAGLDLLTVHNICLNIYIFILFVSEGIQRASIGICANIIGAGKYNELWQLFRSAATLQFIALAIMAIPLLIFPNYLVGLYTENKLIISAAESTMVWCWLYFIVEGITWILGGMLIAGGDTIFVSAVVFFFVWLFRVIPLYLLKQADMLYYATSWQNGNAVDLALMGVFFLRLRSSKWRKISTENILAA